MSQEDRVKLESYLGIFESLWWNVNLRQDERIALLVPFEDMDIPSPLVLHPRTQRLTGKSFPMGKVSPFLLPESKGKETKVSK